MSATTQIHIVKLEQDNCMPCKALSFAINANMDAIAEAGATIETHNVTHEPELIEKYDISSTPTLIFYRNGVEMTRLAGKVAFAEILDAIEYAKEAR